MTAVDPYTLLPGTFLSAIGLTLTPVADDGLATVVRGRLEVDASHHTPWGVVHGGVWAAAIESAASVGASTVVAGRGQFAVGVDNVTDFLRPFRSGTLEVTAHPEQIGRSLQLWQVEITATDGKTIARGRVRLANQDLPT